VFDSHVYLLTVIVPPSPLFSERMKIGPSSHSPTGEPATLLTATLLLLRSSDGRPCSAPSTFLHEISISSTLVLREPQVFFLQIFVGSASLAGAFFGGGALLSSEILFLLPLFFLSPRLEAPSVLKFFPGRTDKGALEWIPFRFFLRRVISLRSRARDHRTSPRPR